ncbi:DUF2867 domain-containing protein [Rhodanobacter sp. B04]|uniref:DUF2867 domain-containing protein n=1 Tax=Rhodanobacter sp. B04 TaxID=1945860 RepID=UPI0020C39B61|nr:DUF2867 domain-containing protein [Rhodanobacter sp. B04]
MEVSLIAQLGHGSGDHLFASALKRQQAHEYFVDALDEPSARLGGTDLPKGDATSLYSFAVGAQGHPFHRHAGHRVFTAISGSGGAQLRFSTATPEQIEADPPSFIRTLHYINIPPDCLFTVRFGGDTWHQFAPLAKNTLHPAFFALSCHTNELGGDLPEPVRTQVLANKASIPSLTMLLPPCIDKLLRSTPVDHLHIPTTHLSLDTPPGTLQGVLCKSARCVAGLIRGAWADWRHSNGFLFESGGRHTVTELDHAPADSLLLRQLMEVSCHHEDMFCLTLTNQDLGTRDASVLLSCLLNGFLNSPPSGVSRMMALRNLLVRPIGLRTSPLACPVSSLLSSAKNNLFDQRFPVLDQAIDHDNACAQVVLGADDKHLIFRSCVSVRVVSNQQIDITLGTRVHCKNLFGTIYMGMIDLIHRRYITPAMLRLAVEQAFPLQKLAGSEHAAAPFPIHPTANAH